MQNIAINIASNLSSSARAAIEGMLGRSLRDDEQVSVHSLNPHPAPVGAARRAAAARLTAAMDALDAKAAHTNPTAAGDGGTSDDFEAAVDEAMNHFRRRR